MRVERLINDAALTFIAEGREHVAVPQAREVNIKGGAAAAVVAVGEVQEIRCFARFARRCMEAATAALSAVITCSRNANRAACLA